MPEEKLATRFSRQAQRLAYAVLGLLFPPRCAVCGRLGEELCQACVSAFPALSGPACTVCGEPQAESTACSRCAARRPLFEYVRSAYHYEGGVQKAIHAMKYRRRQALATPLAEALTRGINTPDGTMVLCPVPLHPDRQAERGFNQAELLAAELAHLWGLFLLPSAALQRIRVTVNQVGLDYKARQANVDAAFAADRMLVADHDILLIDDVCTTGATLNACAGALLAAGAASVYGITLARASKKDISVR